MARIHQAYEGHVLFKNLYTTEPRGRAFFHPLFWLIGTVCHITGASIQAVWAAVHLPGYAFMIVPIYRFAAHVNACRTTRLLVMILVATATGLG